MRIAVPVNEDKTVCVSFGRTPEFMILDTDTREKEFILNDAAASEGGAGIQAAQLLVDRAIDILLTPRCGENAGKVLDAASVQIYKTTSADLLAEIDKYLNGELEILTERPAGFHGFGASR